MFSPSRQPGSLKIIKKRTREGADEGSLTQQRDEDCIYLLQNTVDENIEGIEGMDICGDLILHHVKNRALA